MNAYFFTAAASYAQVRATDVGRGQTADQFHAWDYCVSLVVCGENSGESQAQFEAWLRRSPEGENPVRCEIRRIVAAQFLDQLLTESGPETIDWDRIPQRIADGLPATEGDDFDHGYWADANQLVRPGRLSADLFSLERDLAEDIRSGLNWSVERQFYFIVSVLSPCSPPVERIYEMESDLARPDDAGGETAGAVASDLDTPMAELPELREKEVAALVRARNSVVAAWLWRKFAADTPYAAYDIDMDPWCGVFVLEQPETRPGETS